MNYPISGTWDELTSNYSVESIQLMGMETSITIWDSDSLIRNSEWDWDERVDRSNQLGMNSMERVMVDQKPGTQMVYIIACVWMDSSQTKTP